MGGGGGTSINTVDPVSAGLRFQTSVYGLPLAIIYGKTRVPVNMAWYGDFTPIAHTTTTSSGGGKGGGGDVTSSQTSWTYTASFAMALGEGVVVDILSAWSGKTKVDLNTISQVLAKPDPTQPVSVNNKPGYVTVVTPVFNLFQGVQNQATWSYMDSLHPSQSLTYSGASYIAAANYNLGDSASLPAFSFEVQSAIADPAFSYNGANPKDIIYDLLKNTHYGAAPTFSVGDLTQFANYCGSQGVFLSPCYSEQQSAAQIITDILSLCNSGVYYSEGQMKIVPYGDSYASAYGYTYIPPSSTLINFGDDDFQVSNPTDDPVRVLRNAIPLSGSTTSDAYNQVQLEYMNRLSEYNAEICSAQDQAAIDTFGLIPMSPISAHQINDPTVANTVVNLILQRCVYIRNQYIFSVGWNYADLEPTDPVTITDTGLGLYLKPVRILIVEEDEYGTLQITAEDAPPGVASRVLATPPTGAGYSMDFNVAAGSVFAPVFFEPPVQLTTGTTGLEVWIGVTGVNSKWGGCSVWASNDGASYTKIGMVTAPAKIGHLTADLTTTLALQLDGLGGQIAGGSAIDAQNLATLACIVDSNPEFIAYQGATLTGANAYNLTGLVRGAYNYPINAHLNGAKFVRCDSAIVQGDPLDPSMIGKTIFFKFCSFNVFGGGGQSLGDATEYQYQVKGSYITAAANYWNPALSSFAAVAFNNAVNFTWNLDTYVAGGYEIRVGASWAAGTTIVKGIKSNSFSWQPTTQGNLTFWMKPIIGNGIYSVNAAQAGLTIIAASITGLSQQVIDNNILLTWINVQGSYSIDHAEIRKGTVDWATATPIGKVSGSFATVFETTSGTYKYWVALTDSSGLTGTPSSIYAIVNQPPDYVLRSQAPLTLAGTKTNALLSGGSLYAPVNTTETFQQHFVNNSWTTPQAQVDAGSIYFLQPPPSSASYVETIDYGATIPSSKISLTLTRTTIAGTVTITPKIETSPDNSTWTTFNNVYEAFSTSFRYVKITLTFASTGGGFLQITDSLVRLDVKNHTVSGMGTAVSTDSGGTVVDITGKFVDVASIQVTAQGTSAINAIYDFVDAPNPTQFKVLLYNSSGTRVSGPFSYNIEGV